MKTVFNINLTWMIVIYIITIILGFYTSITIGVIVSILTICNLIFLNISRNKIKNEQNNQLLN